jgi:hypothetical protein
VLPFANLQFAFDSIHEGRHPLVVTRFGSAKLGLCLSFALQKLAYSPFRLETSSEIIADNLSKPDWSWGCVSAIDSNGRTIWNANAHRSNGKRFVVRADEKLTACGG